MRRDVYLIAAGGVGMSALAHLFREKGYEVSGSDRSLYPPVSDFLREIGVPVKVPYSVSNVPPRPSIVVVGNAVSAHNPEVCTVEEKGWKKYSLPGALSEFFMKGKESIVVAGTHGKTTTTSMITHLLTIAGRSPSFFIGGIPGGDSQMPSGIGSGPYFVIEGDEYDSAYFDKKAKFYHYQPRYLVLTSIEYDHADIYPNIETLKDAFRDLVSFVPGEGLILACSDYPDVLDVVKEASCRVVTYSAKRENSDFFIERVEGLVGQERGTVRMGRNTFSLSMKVPGIHNLLNGTAAILIAREIGVPLEEALSGMETYSPVRRRQEVVGRTGGITVIDDFAHHPTAVASTINGVRKFFRPLRIIAIFEPRSNTSRRKMFEERFASALSLADLALIAPPHNPSLIPAEERFSPERVSSRVKRMGGRGIPFDDVMKIPSFLDKEARAGDILLFMSNGDFSGIQERTFQMISGREKNRERERRR